MDNRYFLLKAVENFCWFWLVYFEKRLYTELSTHLSTEFNMKIVLQRVSEASVSVKEKQVGAISKGLLLFAGIHKDDEMEQVEWLAEKILNLRVFNDDEGKMNLSVRAVEGEILVVSQFTLYGDYDQGNRPGYFKAAGPKKAEKLYKKIISYFREESDLKIETGTFGAHMDVRLHNDGPVTLVLER